MKKRKWVRPKVEEIKLKGNASLTGCLKACCPCGPNCMNCDS